MTRTGAEYSLFPPTLMPPKIYSLLGFVMSVYLTLKGSEGKTAENIPWSGMFLTIFPYLFLYGTRSQAGAHLGQVFMWELRAPK